MGELITSIPARLRNVSKNGHVAGAIDIIDDNLNKKQSVINQELDTFHTQQLSINQEQAVFNENTSTILGDGGTVNTRISNAVTQAIEGEVALRSNADALLRAELNAKQLEVNTVPTDDVPTQNSGNRVSSGALYETLKNPEKGFVEDAPSEDSDKLITSKGVAEFINSIDDIPGVKMGVTDTYGTPIFYVDSDDNIIVPLNIESDSINGLEPVKITENDIFKMVLCDNEYNIIIGIDKDDKVISPFLNKTESIKTEEKPEIVINNADKEGYLLNDCLYDTANRRVQLFIVTDTHNNVNAFINAIDATQNYVSVNGLIHLGDNDTMAWASVYDSVEGHIKSMTKPFFFIVGNHEVGTHESYVYMCQDNKLLYDKYIKVSLPYFNLGEYSGGDNNPLLYYYHDFIEDANKVRFIVLCPYDGNVEFDTTYWSPITYDSSIADIKAQLYNVGDRVNVKNYTKFSFECVRQVNVENPSNRYYDDAYDKYPKYKAQRWLTWYSQQQLEWFCNVLNSVPEGYNVIIAQHETMLCTENSHNDKTTRFSNNKTSSIKGYPTGAYVYVKKDNQDYVKYEALPRYSAYGKEIPDYNDIPGRVEKDRDIISQIVNAWQNNERIKLDIIAESHYYVRRDHTENGVYVVDRKQYDDCSGMEVHIDYTFANNVANKRPLFLSAHNHNDGILRSDKYEQTEVKFLSGVVENKNSKDIIRTTHGKNMDALTALTFYNDGEYNNLHLTRLGADVTNTIDTNINTLVRKTNEIIKI